ncbi:hypothetical protein P7C70_g4864, partial [Phenoliferia sp. Uapishka_3]
MAAAPQTELSFGHWSAWISVDGAPVALYGIKEEAERRRTIAYIEAHDDNSFVAHTRDNGQHPWSTDMVTHILLDGQQMDGLSIRKASRRWALAETSPGRVDNFPGRYVSSDTLQPFIFGKPALTEDADAACSDEKIIKNLGTVQVNHHRTNIKSNVPAAEYNFTKDKVPDKPLLNEKSKKVLSHQAQLGNAIPTKKVATVGPRHTYVDPLDSPLHTFEFRYMSRELKGHVEALPKSPSPSPAPPGSNDRKGKKRQIETITINSDSDSDEDEEATKAKIRRLQAKLAKSGGAGSLESGKVKKEKEVKREKGVKPEVIELD